MSHATKFALSIFATVAALQAQSVVVPASSANVSTGGGLNTLTRDLNNPRTYMLGLPASELAAIPQGSVITGLSFRAYSAQAAAWPAADMTWADYEVRLGAAAPLATWTTTFATNFAGTPTQVRDGLLLVTAGTYTTTSPAPHPFTNTLFFDFQDVYPYTGGDLAVHFTHPGANAAGALFLDVITGAPATGVAYSGTGFNVATGAVATFSIPRVHYGYGTTCPGTNNAKPVLNLTSNTTGGGPITLGVGNARVSSPIAFLFGGVKINAPLPGGCALLTNPVVVLPAMTDANGRAFLNLTVPASAIGTVHIQSAVVDPVAPAGYVTTNGVSLVAN